MSRAQDPFVLSFGVKRRVLPENIKQTIYSKMDMKKRQIDEDSNEDNEGGGSSSRGSMNSSELD